LNIQDLFIEGDLSIKKAIKKLDKTGKKILLIVEDRKLIGVLTDGDIRRWILKNGNLQESVSCIMNTSPKYIYERDINNAKQILMEKRVEAMPVLNSNKEVTDIVFWNDNFEGKFNYYNKLKTPVVIMAGGRGTRLEPYTKILPKPLIPIGDTPIVERIINRFAEYGCDKFYMTVNYKKNMIKAYFSESNRAYEIDYIEEGRPLGTAGSLSLLKGELKETFFVSNCDILIDANYSDIFKHHKENKNKITLVTSLKHYVIPYGVIEIAATSEVQNMIEKPEYDYLVNTGMYVLEPDVLKHVPENTFFHITDLINYYIQNGKKIGVYPVSDKEWLDMGEFKEMENMIGRLGLR